MPITVDWATKTIFVPRTADEMTQIDIETWQLDTNAFHQELRYLEASEDGIPFDITHNHNTQVVLGGITFARVVEIINGYTVTFEDDVYIVNMYGSNSNILDVTNLNSVSLRSDNSAGLIVAGSGVTASDVTDIVDAVWDAPVADHETAGTTGERQSKMLTVARFLGLK